MSSRAKQATSARLFVFIVLIVLGAATAAGQQPREKMSRDEMMKGCRQHCQATTKSIDRMHKMMEDARQSNDPAKMREALQEGQKPLGDMKQHMSMCMNMMDMMEGMHGMGGMMGRSRGMMSAKTYYFCSEADKTAFEKDPEKYVKELRQ